jgi:hypothetical protein
MIEPSYSTSQFDRDDRMGGTAKAPPEEKPAHRLDSTKMLSLHRKMQEWFMQEQIRQAHNRYQMALDQDYYDALQWTEDDAQVLLDRGQSPAVFNEIKPTVDWVIGTERRTRIDYKVMPRNKEGLKDADNKTKLLKYLSDVNKTPFHRSYAFADAAKCGMGVLETGLRGDPTEELLFTRSENWRFCLYDSNAREPDMSDARYFFRWKWVDLDVAEAYFPDRKDVIRPAATSNQTVNGDEDDGDIWYMGARVTNASEDYAPAGKYRPYAGSAFAGSTRERVRLYECWYTKPVPVKRFSAGPAEGETFDPKNPEHVLYARQGLSTFDKVEMQVWCSIYTDKGIVWNGRSPYRHNRIPFVIVWAYRRARDNAPYGIIRNLRDPQDDLNKRASKALHILSSKQVIMDAGAVEDVEELREEVARPDGIIEKRPGKALEIRTEADLARDHLGLMERDIAHIRNVGGVNNENLGRQTNATSGVAITARQEQGSVVTTELFDNLRFAVQALGEMELANIEQFYDQPKVVRVVGERGNASFVELNKEGPNGEIVNSVTANHADFVVSEQDFRSSLRQAMFESMFDLVGRLGQVNPQVALNLLDLVVEMVDVPNRDELVSRIRKLNGQRDPDAEPTPEEQAEMQQAAQQAAIQQQIQNETLMNTLRKLKAEGSKLDAQTVQTHVDAMLAALEGAQVVAAAPATAPIADEIMRSAGFKDATPEETMPQGIQPPAMPPAQPMQPPPMANGLAPTEGV